MTACIINYCTRPRCKMHAELNQVAGNLLQSTARKFNTLPLGQGLAEPLHTGGWRCKWEIDVHAFLPSTSIQCSLQVENNTAMYTKLASYNLQHDFAPHPTSPCMHSSSMAYSWVCFIASCLYVSSAACFLFLCLPT